MAVAPIEIGERHRAIGLVERVRIGCAVQLAERRRLRVAGDGRRIVGAGDGDGHVLGDKAAMMVVDLDGVGQRHLLVVSEVVEIMILCREFPGLGAGRAIARIGEAAERQPLQHG